jgi:predicted GNAT family acetyltransferase
MDTFMERPAGPLVATGGRVVSEADWKEWDRLNLAMGTELNLPRDPDPQKREKVFLDRVEKIFNYGSDEGGVLVATAAVLIDCRAYDAVGAVYCDTNFRRKGHARKAVSRLVEERGHKKKLILGADPDATAIQLYRDLGFQETGKYGLFFRMN